MAVRARGGPRPVKRDRSSPLWQQIHDDLVRRLDAGEFVRSFPSELDLADQYEVSRQTVREALRRLRAAGVVRGERGRTSRLTDPAEIDQPLGTLYSLFFSVEAAGQEQCSVVRQLKLIADGVVSDRLGLEGSTPLIYLERLRLAGGAPLALDRVWLPASVARPLLEADFTRTALYAELRERCGVGLTDGEERLRAVVATNAEKQLLDLPAGVAVLSIERIGFNRRTPLEWRHTLVRGDRFAVSTQFSARFGYRVTGGDISYPVTRGLLT